MYIYPSALYDMFDASGAEQYVWPITIGDVVRDTKRTDWSKSG